MRLPAAVFACALVLPAYAVVPGQPAPSFALPDASGATLSLAALKGRVVYVDFWASWCTPCRRSFPWMSAMQARYARDGLAIVGINVDKRRADADRFLDDVAAKFDVVFDAAGTTPAAYAVKAMPSSFLVDRHGNVVAVEEGFHDERRDALEAQIRRLLAQP
jgi:thiol-disulfide isomerase/thioredoxin